MSDTVWEHLKQVHPEIVLTPVNATVRGWSKTVEALQGMVEVPIKVNNPTDEIFTIPVGIMKNDDLPCCLLLGNNFLDKYKFVINFRDCVI